MNDFLKWPASLMLFFLLTSNFPSLLPTLLLLPDPKFHKKRPVYYSCCIL